VHITFLQAGNLSCDLINNIKALKKMHKQALWDNQQLGYYTE